MNIWYWDWFEILFNIFQNEEQSFRDKRSQGNTVHGGKHSYGDTIHGGYTVNGAKRSYGDTIHGGYTGKRFHGDWW